MNEIRKHGCYQHFQLSTEQVNWVESSLRKMDAPKLVGQLFLAYMMHEKLPPEQQLQQFADRVQHEIKVYHLGGYYLNKYYYPTTTAIINRLQETAEIPLFIAADMENGAGSGFGGVIAPGLTTFPAPMAVGATGSPQYAYQMGYWTAAQAAWVGVNYIFAPAVDVNNNPDNPIINIRAFSEDPELVAVLSSAYIRGVQDGGAASSAKHFPGHGDVSEDSHLKLSTVKGDRKRLDEIELYPYHRVINEAQVDSIMTAHLCVPAIEPDNRTPATFSSKILQDLLRGEMGYDGLIVTDALLMGGVTEVCGPGEAAVRSILAGNDILLMTPQLDEAYAAVLEAVESGKISQERLHESVRRILSMKAKYNLDERRVAALEPLPHDAIDRANEISYHVCCDAVTLVKNADHTLPLDPSCKCAVIFLSDTTVEACDCGDAFFHAVIDSSSHSMTLALDPDTRYEDFEVARDYMRQADTVIFGVDVRVLPEKGSVDVPDSLASLIDQALQTGKNVVLVSFGNPYLIRRFPGVDAYLCAYSYFDAMAVATAAVIFGERIPHGKFPVSVPELFERGTGLSF